MRRIWDRLDKPVRVAVVVGVILAVGAIPLSTVVAMLVGLAAAAILGYAFPSDHLKVGVTVAAPILTVAFLVGLVRGVGAVTLLVVLGCSLILPVGLARVGAGARLGSGSRS